VSPRCAGYHCLMDHLRDRISSRYDVVIDSIPVEAEVFSVMRVRDTNVLLDRIDPASFAVDERLPYWSELWSSSLELARYCISGANVRGLKVLELGCGLGLAGIAAAYAGAEVTMTDYEEDALLFAAYNAMLNLPENVIGTRLSFVGLDWRRPPVMGRFDLVIGGDVVYDRSNFGPIRALLHAVLHPDGMAVLTDPGRGIGEDFFRAAAGEFTVDTYRTNVVLHGRRSVVTRNALRKRIMHDSRQEPA